MSSFSKIFAAVLALSAVAVASPIKGSQPAEQAAECADPNSGANPQAPAPGTGNAVKHTIHPVIYNVYPQDPERWENPVDAVRLEAWEGKSQLEQVIYFKDIPSNAKNCKLALGAGPAAHRIFLTKAIQPKSGESHLANYHKLSALVTDGKVSYKAVQGLYTQDVILGQFDFDNWAVSGVNGDFATKDVPCVENLALKLGYDGTSDQKAVFMHQDDKTGIFLRYEQ